MGTSIAVAAEQQPRPHGAARGAQPGHQHHAGTPRAITRPAKGPRRRVPPHPPTPRVRTGRAQLTRKSRAEPPRSSRPRTGASSVRWAGPCAGRSPGSARRASAVAGLGSPSHGTPKSHRAPCTHRRSVGLCLPLVHMAPEQLGDGTHRPGHPWTRPEPHGGTGTPAAQRTPRQRRFPGANLVASYRQHSR